MVTIATPNRVSIAITNAHHYAIGEMCFFFFSSRRRHTRFDCDWSSDVCSSDLSLLHHFHTIAHSQRQRFLYKDVLARTERGDGHAGMRLGGSRDGDGLHCGIIQKIGRASCRGRGEISGGGVSFKKKKKKKKQSS